MGHPFSAASPWFLNHFSVQFPFLISSNSGPFIQRSSYVCGKPSTTHHSCRWQEATSLQPASDDVVIACGQAEVVASQLIHPLQREGVGQERVGGIIEREAGNGERVNSGIVGTVIISFPAPRQGQWMTEVRELRAQSYVLYVCIKVSPFVVNVVPWRCVQDCSLIFPYLEEASGTVPQTAECRTLID